MSDAIIRSGYGNMFYGMDDDWMANVLSEYLGRYTFLIGYADNERTVHFHVPVCSNAQSATTGVYYINTDKVLRWSFLDYNMTAVKTTITRSMVSIQTDGAGMHYLRIDVPIDSAKTGGAFGILYTQGITESVDDFILEQWIHSQEYTPSSGPAHPALLERIHGNWITRLYAGAYAQGTHLHKPQIFYTSSGTKADGLWFGCVYGTGDYTYYTEPALQGADTFYSNMPASGDTVTSYASTHKYSLKPSQFGDNDEGALVTLVRGNAKQVHMGIAHSTLRIGYDAFSGAHTAFMSEQQEVESISGNSNNPYLLPAYVTVIGGSANAHICIPFNNICYQRRFKVGKQPDGSTDYVWRWTSTSNLKVTLKADGDSTERMGNIATVRAGTNIRHFAGGLVITVKLASSPTIGEHAGFVLLDSGSITITSPEAVFG